MERSEGSKESSGSQSQQSQSSQQQLVELKQEIINHSDLHLNDGHHHHHHNSGSNTTTIICECDGAGNLTQVGEQEEEDGGQLGDQNLEDPINTQLRIKVDVDDPSEEEGLEHLAQLSHSNVNVTSANIITIPVVPYTVIGETQDGVGIK